MLIIRFEIVRSIMSLRWFQTAPDTTVLLHKYLQEEVQWNLSIMVTLGPDISGLYIQVAVIEKTCIRWSAAF